MDLYREEILEHWQNPQNFGEMEKPDVVVEQINPLCGDQVTFFFKLSPLSSSRRVKLDKPSMTWRKRGSRNWIPDPFDQTQGKQVGNDKLGSRQARTIIEDVRFTGSGCAISIASASMLSENIKGRSISELAKMTGQDILEMIGGPVAPARLKCAFLGLEAVKKLQVKSDKL